MNQIDRKVWGARLGTSIAASKNTRHHHGKDVAGVVSAVMVGVLLACASTAHAVQASDTLPTGAQVVAGSVNLVTSGSTLNVTQSTARAAINWQTFNVGSAATVNFNQPDRNAITLNRVVGNERSVIDGAINANGNVWILNSGGILFNQGAQVNVGGLVASTLQISDSDFMAGKSTFESNGSAASVINLGMLHAADQGHIALLGQQVSNEGIIQARLGSAVLAAGDKVSLNFNGNSLVGVSVDRGTLNALVENKQAIIADGGMVTLTAKGLDQVMATVVNNTGEIRAQTIDNHDGHIYLLGGMDNDRVVVSGVLDASAPNGGDGGFVETSAASVKIMPGAQITTQANAGQNNGSWLVDPNDFTIAASGGDIDGATLAANLLTTNVTITSAQGGTSGNGDIFVNDAINLSASSARHTLTLQADRDIVFQNGSGIDATANSNTQALDIVLWANHAGAGGEIVLGHQSYVRSNGGYIWLGGGTGSTTWHGLTVGNGYATGRASVNSGNGIVISSGSYLDSGSGLIGMRANSDQLGGFAIDQYWDGGYGNAYVTALGGVDIKVQTGNVRFSDGVVLIGNATGSGSTSIFDIGASNDFHFNDRGGGTAELNGTVQFVSANNVSISNRNWSDAHATSVTIGTSDISGNFTLESASSNGVITQSGALSVAGKTTVYGKSITLTNTGNSLVGATDFEANDDISIYNNRDLVYDVLTSSNGNVSLTVNGNITTFAPGSSSYVEIDTGSITLNVGATHDISLDAGGYLLQGPGGGINIVSARNVNLSYGDWNTAAVDSLSANIAGNLTIHATTYGNTLTINQTGALHIGGTTTIEAGTQTWNPYIFTVDHTVPVSVNFNNTANVFGGAVSITGAQATIKASTNLTLGNMDVDSLLAVAGTGKNITQNGNITTYAGNAVLVADSANGGVYTNTSGTISATGGHYYIYSHDPSSTTLGGVTPTFTHMGDTYASYAPGSVTESGDGVIYLSTLPITPPSTPGTTPSNSSTTSPVQNVIANIANLIGYNTTNVPGSGSTSGNPLLPPSFLAAAAQPAGTGSVSTLRSNVVVVPAGLKLDFASDAPLMLMSAPTGKEPSTAVSLSQARDMMGGNAGGASGSSSTNVANNSSDSADNGNHDVRVPVSRNSLAEIVNGGVRLPSGVEQQLFVVRK